MAHLIVADASVLIAWLDGRDEHHPAAIEVLAGVERFIVAALTVTQVLAHPARHSRDAQVVTRLETIGKVVSTLPIDSRSLAQLRATTGLSMPDCVVLACARDHDLDIATFDTRLRETALSIRRS